MTKSTPTPKGYKLTKIGTLPVEWEVVKLKNIVAKIESGTSVNCSPDSKSNRKILKTSAVTLGAFSPLETKIPLKEEEDKLSTKAKAGHILVCRKNSPTLVGSSVLVNCLEEELYLPDLLWQLIPSQSHKDISTFLFYSLNEGHTEFRIRNLASGSSESMRNISKKSYLNLQIPLPPLPEQQKIAQILSTWDDAIRLQTQRIDAKKEQKRGLMQRLLTGEVRLAGFEKKWRFKKLGNMLKYEQPTKYLVSSKEYSDKYKTPVLTAGKTFLLGYTKEVEGIYQNLPVILFDDFTTASKYIDFPFKVKSSATKFLTVRSDEFSLKFLYELMQILEFTPDSHKRFWISEYSEIDVKVPGIEEQTAIATILTTADREITLLETQFTELKEQKRGLMQRLLTGQVRVNVSN